MFQGIAKPITKVYFGVRSHIHLRHFRGRSIHSPFMYGMVRNVFMRNHIEGPDTRLYDQLREVGLKESTSIMLQNMMTYSRLDSFQVIDPKNGSKTDSDEESASGPGHKLCVLLPGVSVQTLMEAARQASLREDTLVILAPYLTRRGREAAQSIRHHYPCVSVDRCNMVIYIFNTKLQPQHYRI